MSTTTDSNTPNTSSIQGILFKRRDVFRNIWRPRVFVLDTDDAVMTYHLLSRDVGAHHHSNSTSPVQEEELQSGIDYDVSPRGTIYLGGGCEIAANEHLSRPNENLYVFTITPPPHADSGPCFLATTTLASRNEWIEKLASACGTPTTNTAAGDDATTLSVDGTESIMSEALPSSAEEPSEALPWTNPSPKAVLQGVPRRLAQRIEQALSQYLPLCDDASTSWKPLFSNDAYPNLSAFERRYNHFNMLKTVAIIPYSPLQVFSLLVNVNRRRDFETNVRFDERLKQLNSHTFLDYYAYQAVWPTLARDFAVVLHWRVLYRGDDERAICIIAFSDDSADALRPPSSDHVRADLKISLYLIQPTNDGNATKVTRILSYDLCGNVPKSLTNKVLQQQATMPLVISQHLRETTESSDDSTTTATELSNEFIEKNVISKLSEKSNGDDDGNKRRRPKYAERGESLLLQEDFSLNDEEGTLGKQSLFATALLLLTPLVLWSFANSLQLPGKEVYFILAALLAVRAVVLGNLGVRYDEGNTHQYVDKVTCRFSVDLKGVLRFIANRKDEQEEEQIESCTEISVIHIVLCAIAVAMRETPSLKCKRVHYPLIGIDGYYSSRGVDISLLVPSAEDGKQDDVYNLFGIGKHVSVQSIADRIVEQHEDEKSESDLVTNLSRAFGSLLSWVGLGREQSLGRCLLIASPDHSEHGEVDIDASPLPDSNVNVVVVVGGVRLVRDSKPATTPAGRTTIKAPPKPTLSMSITIDCPICNVASGRRFAERVQQLVQFPEMCED